MALVLHHLAPRETHDRVRFLADADVVAITPTANTRLVST